MRLKNNRKLGWEWDELNNLIYSIITVIIISTGLFRTGADSFRNNMWYKEIEPKKKKKIKTFSGKAS